jgi:DNA-binding NtrC family response regulator
MLAEIIAMSQRDESARGPRFLSGFVTSIQEAFDSGRLLPELFAVLAPLVIELPPLRQRRGDIAAFAEHFARRFAEDPETANISPEALQLLSAHSWPGNLHELADVVATAQRHAGAERIESSHLPHYLRVSSATECASKARTLPLDKVLEEVERRLIAIALRLARDNKTRAAEILAIWRPRLLRRMQVLGFAGANGETESSGPPAAEN